MSSFVDGIRDQAARAKFEAGRLVRLQREQNKLGQLQGQKRDLLGNLGEIVWDMFEAGQINDPRLLTVCRQAQSLNQEIATQEANIEQIRQEAPPEPPKCPRCGREINLSDAFCPGCGAIITPAVPQPAPAAQSPAASRICPNCGKVMRSGAGFCSSCGARVPI